MAKDVSQQSHFTIKKISEEEQGAREDEHKERKKSGCHEISILTNFSVFH